MARLPIAQEIKEKVLVDWRMGELSQFHIADKHKISKGTVNAICKGVEQDGQFIVTKVVESKQLLAEQNKLMLTAVTDEVDRRTRNLLWLDNATMKNLNVMMKKVNETLPVKEHRDVQAAIKDGKETMYGKAPDTIINNTNAQQVAVDWSKFSDAELRQYRELQGRIEQV